MKAIIKLGGKITLEIEDKEEMDTLHKAIVLSHPRTKCDHCNAFDGREAEFYYTSNKDTEGNTYINFKCGKCGAASKLGRYKAGGFFWHKFELYVPKNEKGGEE